VPNDVKVDMSDSFRLLKIALPLAMVSVFIFGSVLHSQGEIFHEFQAALLSVQWMLLACVAVWCGSFVFLTFKLNDLPLIGLLLISIAAYFIGYAASSQAMDATILLAGVTLGKAARFFIGDEVTSLISKPGNQSETPYVVSYFLIGLLMLLAFSSFWHLDMSANYYHGPRWMGLWNNPNIYGMLMSAGLALAAGLLIGERSRLGCRSARPASNLQNINDETPLTTRGTHVLPIILFIAACMMAVGLLFSYSRGAWVGTAVGLLYLAKIYGKLKWKYVAIGFGLLALGVVLFWGHTPDNAPWYVKRMDFGRPSAQHRVSAWRGALQMMRDYPLGVGWNKAVETYDKNYSPPEDGAGAITMNSYLMLGTELGIPGLLCFVAYVGLCFRKNPHLIRPAATFFPSDAEKGKILSPVTCHLPLQATCRSGALVLLVAFWFDGGLFDLPTASLFWILLELGSVSNAEGVTSAATK